MPESRLIPSGLAEKTGQDLLDASADCDKDLDRIEVVLRGVLEDNRDGLLEVGGLCYHFVADRLARGYTCQGSRMLLRDRLGTVIGKRINPGRLTALYFVSTLLGDGDCGRMSLSTLKEFGLFIQHNRRTEVWSIKPDHVEAAVGLFIAARDNGWGRDTVRRAVSTRFPWAKKYAPRHRQSGQTLLDPSNPLNAVKFASVKDAGELLANIIAGHVQTDRLVVDLLSRLPQLRAGD